jgi:hypothetical protein
MSKNAVTIEQLKIACQNVLDLRAAGMSNNLAIRNLEQFANIYAKFKTLGHVSPDHALQYDRWSVAALKLEAENPGRKHGEYLRVEHGTPRRKFAEMVLDGFLSGKLTTVWLDDLCEMKWRVAVITHEEDSRFPRSKALDDPEERWREAGIEVSVRPKAKAGK